MTTFKKKFTIKSNNGWIEPPERMRCGAAIKTLVDLALEMQRKNDKTLNLRIIKSGVRTAKCEIECPDRETYEALKLMFLYEKGTYFDWRG